MMESEFIIMIDGQLQRFTDYADIPDRFDHVIKFAPWIAPGPHTHDEHDELALWNDRLQRLMEIERASSNQSR